MSRSQTWFDALSTQTLPSPYRSIAIADSDLGSGTPARLLAVVPDPDNEFPRARHGEVGLLEGIGVARAIREVIELDASLADDQRRSIVAVVDIPSQAYGRLEEQFGEHLYIAAAVAASAAARVAGHPVIALVVGSAISGGFLAHGLQASQILALDDDKIEIQAIHKPAAARITLRTIAELDELAKIVTPLSFDVREWATLGYCDGLLKVTSTIPATAEPAVPTRSQPYNRAEDDARIAA